MSRHYHVEIRRNGAPFGSAGPYLHREDAEGDARALGAVPGMIGVVVPCACTGRRRSNPAPAAVAGGAATAAVVGRVALSVLPLVLPLISSWTRGKLDAYLAGSPAEQVAMLRTLARWNPALRLALRDDARAEALAQYVAGYLRKHGDEAVAAVEASAVAAAQRAARNGPRRKARRKTRARRR